MQRCPSLQVRALCEYILLRATAAEAEAIRVAASQAIVNRKQEADAARLAFARELIPTIASIDVLLEEPATVIYYVESPDMAPAEAFYPWQSFYPWQFDAAAPGRTGPAPFALETHRKIVAFIRGQK